jgi:hypothetical protein
VPIADVLWEFPRQLFRYHRIVRDKQCVAADFSQMGERSVGDSDSIVSTGAATESDISVVLQSDSQDSLV